MIESGPSKKGNDSLGGQILDILRTRSIWWTIVIVVATSFIVSIVLTQVGNARWSLIGAVGSGLLPFGFTLWQFFDHRHIENAYKKVSKGIKPSSLESLSKEIESVARTPQHEWTAVRISDQQAILIERLVHLLAEAGVYQPRACLYEVNLDGRKTDVEGNQLTDLKELAQIETVDELAYLTHHGGRKPKDLYRQITHQDGTATYQSRRHHNRNSFKNEPRGAGLFEPLTTKNVSREGSRYRYNAKSHNWRASVRMPLFVGVGEVELLLTVDTTEKHGMTEEYDGLLALAGSLLSLLLATADGEVTSDNTSGNYLANLKTRQKQSDQD